MANCVEIKSGPSKFDLMLALFDCDIDKVRTVSFELSNGTEIEVGISSVEREDGSGESWNINAFIWWLNNQGCYKPNQRIKIYYTTQYRRGRISTT
jgi:hypothetical protein